MSKILCRCLVTMTGAERNDLVVVAWGSSRLILKWTSMSQPSSCSSDSNYQNSNKHFISFSGDLLVAHSDIIKVAGFDSEGFPTNDDGIKCWRLICGLIAWQRAGINVHFENLAEPARQGLFDIMKQYLQFSEGTSEAELNRVRGAACKSIAKLHRSFNSKLVRNYVNEGKEPFELHRNLDRQDWEMFVETATSEQFKEKNEHFKNLSVFTAKPAQGYP